MEVRKKFLFDGKSSLDFGCYITESDTFNSASKTQSKISVPGRNGDVIVSDNRYDNVPYSIKVGMYGSSENDLHYKIRELRSYLLSRKGYCRLEDDYHSDEYRMAQFADSIDFDITNLIVGEATLTFDAKPQHFLKSGETKLVFTANGKIENPTYFESNPLLRVYGQGKLEIGSGLIKIKIPSSISSNYIDIDCETWNCTEESNNMNAYVTVSKNGAEHYFPTLEEGTNQVVLGTGITKVEVIPRWWLL